MWNFWGIKKSCRASLDLTLVDEESKKHFQCGQISGCAPDRNGPLKCGHVSRDMVLADIEGRKFSLIQVLNKSDDVPAVGLDCVLRQAPFNPHVAYERICEVVLLMGVCF